MSLVEIRNLLQMRLTSISNPLPTAWENSKFEPDAGQPWQKVNLLPADPLNPTICRGQGDLVYEHGIFQVSLYYPLFVGPNIAATKADEIKDHFHRGLVLGSGSVCVTIERTPSIAPFIEEDGWYMTPISINYYSYIRS